MPKIANVVDGEALRHRQGGRHSCEDGRLVVVGVVKDGFVSVQDAAASGWVNLALVAKQ